MNGCFTRFQKFCFPDEKNSMLYRKYRQLAGEESNIIFGGRLGEYRYYDMDEVIASALVTAKAEL